MGLWDFSQDDYKTDGDTEKKKKKLRTAVLGRKNLLQASVCETLACRLCMYTKTVKRSEWKNR